MITNLTEHCCTVCKITYWITAKHESCLRDCHNTFYCPNGHTQYYPHETEEEKLKKKLKILESNYTYESSERKRLAKSNSALRGVITKKNKELTNDQD